MLRTRYACHAWMKPKQPAAQSCGGKQNRTESVSRSQSSLVRGRPGSSTHARLGAGGLWLARGRDQPKRPLIILGRIDVYETTQIRVDRAQFLLPYSAHRHRVHNFREALLALCEHRVDRVNAGLAINRMQRLDEPCDFGDYRVIVLEHRAKR